MARFQFRLARLLKLREIDEELARDAFLAADHKARDAERAVELASQERARAIDDARAMQSSAKLEPHALLAAGTCVERALVRLQERTRVAQGLRAKAEAERATWTARRADLKGLERLQDRDRDAWRAEEGRREAQTLDEVASVRAQAARRAAEKEGRSWETPSVSMRDRG